MIEIVSVGSSSSGNSYIIKTEEQLNKISEHVGDLIYKNKIRSDQIDENYLLLLRGIL